ncbi:hypothetical protein FQR65_LT06456 [Abscondita terminalis]|nr:hypothetical protein FQR65_LT06456 [Abscondita terminalis]
MIICLRQCRGHKVIISENLLKEKAKEFASKTLRQVKGGLQISKRDMQLCFKKFGECGIVDVAVCLDWHGKLKTLIENYDARDILIPMKMKNVIRENIEEPATEPLVDISGDSISDFVQVNEDVTASDSLTLTDGQILSATDTNEKNNDEDDISKPLAEVSVKEARFSFNNLQNFCLQNKSDEKTLQTLHILKKLLSSLSNSNVI